MSRKQWIWLIVAVLVFAAAGAASVAVNTWSKRAASDWFDTSAGSLYGSLLEGAETALLPDEPFLAKLDIQGPIVSGDGVASLVAGSFDENYILDYIDRLMACESNVGILLYVNSGGGEMGASDEIYLKLMDYKEITGRPVYAYFDDTACSGAYYISMAADEIYANRNCICVNIGVYIETYNLSGLFEKYGVEEIMIRSSENKGIGAIGQEWTEEQLAIYQSIVDLYYDQFLEVVAAGRNMTKDTVRARDDGREMLAVQALETGFIDGICRWEEYRDQVLGYFGEDVPLYEEEASEEDMISQLLRYLQGTMELPSSGSELGILRDLMDRNGGVVVMAYGG